TMSASATAILVWNAIPVFADIDPNTFNLDPDSIEKNISRRTKAIMVPDIFGQAADLTKIMAIAKKHNLKVIEDAAQAPGAMYKGRYVGTVADIGVFSLNYHKHIQTGEGGMCVTNDKRLAERMRLIRNHGEVVAKDKDVGSIVNIIGFNFRMTEIDAAIGIEQLKKLQGLLKAKVRSADRLTSGLKGLEGLTPPFVQNGCTHVYYVYPLVLDTDKAGASRYRIVRALIAEGVPNIFEGYSLIHQLPLYQKKIAYGTGGYPWSAAGRNISYRKGICPKAEELHDHTFIGMELCKSNYTDREVDLVIAAFKKVWANRREL
ncbi:MAG: DegT/DnrJ/EryC1/StrS family aminotransferase, partial [Candidatus Omnitrophica bacterium]|nr:DegT/DnrJ/EryC1/StrS family aminotransferase [Candidatus Omnitrophota bacterium]